ncbi:uncharacterized protein LOC142334280 [Lycorma delicatula]|uniref:uncharacterized protein LOC142334280 n=1 Tax=Lycorma delicatula TaxID=130591 RepID=UPI003F515ED5
MESNTYEKYDLSFTSLLWNDVLFPHVFSYLSLRDIFTLRGISKDCKKLIDCYLSQMKTCDLSRYNKVFSPIAFMVLVQNCTQLRSLFVRNYSWLTNDLLKSIILNNKFISSVDLSFCCNLTSAALQPVIIFLKDLKYLKLEHCLWLTTGCLEALALHHDKLEVLSLSSCSIGNSQAINILLQRSKNLIELNLSGLQCISDSTMEVIAHCNKKLKLLNINGCYQVTSYGATMVGEYCTELDYLFVSGCPITFQTIQHLKKKVHFLDYIKRDYVSCEQDNFAFLVHLPV